MRSHTTRAQIAEVGRRKTPRYHLQDIFERLGRQVVERIRATHQVIKGDNILRFHGDARHHLLGEDVKAVQRHTQVLDISVQHGAAKRGTLEQVGRRLGDHASLADAVHNVPGAADALHTAGHVSGRFNLTDEVDRPHVDAQLERCRRHDRGQLALFEGLFRRAPFVQADTAVMGAETTGFRFGRVDAVVGKRIDLAVETALIGELVEPRRQLFHHPSIIGEDDRRSMSLHQLE